MFTFVIHIQYSCIIYQSCAQRSTEWLYISVKTSILVLINCVQRLCRSPTFPPKTNGQGHLPSSLPAAPTVRLMRQVCGRERRDSASRLTLSWNLLEHLCSSPDSVRKPFTHPRELAMAGGGRHVSQPMSSERRKGGGRPRGRKTETWMSTTADRWKVN